MEDKKFNRIYAYSIIIIIGGAILFLIFTKLTGRNITYYSEFYLRRGNNIYFILKSNRNESRLVEEADPETFSVYEDISLSSEGIFYETNSDYFAYDKHNLYFKGVLVEGVDPDDYELLDQYGYGVGGDKVYYCENVIDEVDIDTFQVLDRGYAKDKSHVYKDGVIVDTLDPEIFTVESLDFVCY
ncbi:MAG TPA: hypothetical protein ENN64_00385 [bacterium]|nr:hypothetical protein [bacterium]